MGRPSKQTLPKTLQIRSSTQYRVFNSSPFFITRFPSIIKLFTSSVVDLSFLLQLGQPFSFFLSISYMEIVSIDLRSSFSSIHTSCLFYSHPLSVRLHAFILIALFLTFLASSCFLRFLSLASSLWLPLAMMKRVKATEFGGLLSPSGPVLHSKYVVVVVVVNVSPKFWPRRHR